MTLKPWLATYRDNGIPETVNADAWPSVVHLLEDAMRRYADKPAFRAFGQTLSFAEYDRSKLLGSFNLALRKRPVSTDQIDSAIERIEEKLLNLGQREVISSRIGELVMRELKKLDKVAYIRFASVYRSFEDIDDFRAMVDEVRK